MRKSHHSKDRELIKLASDIIREREQELADLKLKLADCRKTNNNGFVLDKTQFAFVYNLIKGEL